MAGTGSGSCIDPNIGCPSVAFSIRDFPPGSTWSVTCNGTSGSISSGQALRVNGSGDGYSWSGRCYYAPSNSWVGVTLSNGSGSYSARNDNW